MCNLFILLMLHLLQFGFAHSQADCALENGCLKCGPYGCMKCSDLLLYPSRKCLSKCPNGYASQWSNYSDYMGRICVQRGTLMGLTNEGLTVLTGVLAGAAVCLVVISVALAFLHFRRKSILNSSELSSDVDESPDRKEFIKQLNVLRPFAHMLLAILNGARRQLRESHLVGDHPAIAIHRPIIRDLAKLLLLLNRPPEHICMPDDWEHLFTWAQTILKRCKCLSYIPQPHVGQLINFLHTPLQPRLPSPSALTTFKPEQAYGSTASLQHATIKSLNDNYENGLSPHWKFDYNTINSRSQFNPTLWQSSNESLQNQSLFLDDDFCQLGFRPQDEITTEL